jgi:class 3 adenylate cyclase
VTAAQAALLEVEPMSATRTVAFLFTDIEDSTRLLRRLGPRYVDALDQHHAIVGRACERNGGRIVDVAGDGVFSAFDDATAALAAASEAQDTLRDHRWPRGVGLRVRMGVHLGEAIPAGERFIGLAVHMAARICALAAGGEILVSDDVRCAVRNGERFEDMGAHELKGFDAAVPLYAAAVG